MIAADFPGKIWQVSFAGLAPTDFRKCVAMSRKMNGRFDGTYWTFDGSYGINDGRLAEMADRGAIIEEVHITEENRMCSALTPVTAELRPAAADGSSGWAVKDCPPELGWYGNPWHCEAYGAKGVQVGALCFIAPEGERKCGSPGECSITMAAERQRVLDRIRELAASGDALHVHLAEFFTSPDQLLNGGEGEEEEPPIGTDCPECHEPAAYVLSEQQALCRNDACQILMWDPTQTLKQMRAEPLHEIDLSPDPRERGTGGPDESGQSHSPANGENVPRSSSHSRTSRLPSVSERGDSTNG